MGILVQAEGARAVPCSLRTAAWLAVVVFAGPALAQSLTVLPVSVQMRPGQLATSLTIVNQGTTESAIQVRAFKWSQTADGSEQLTPSDDVVASPPIATIAPNATQVVRLILRRRVQVQEGSYRLLVDQIPPAAQSGTVRIALRLSIPVFAEPATRANAHVAFHVEQDASGSSLVAVNDGKRHETLRDIKLATAEGEVLPTESNVSPYILAGTTHRWRFLAPARQPSPGEALHLTARAEATGAVDQTVAMVARP